MTTSSESIAASLLPEVHAAYPWLRSMLVRWATRCNYEFSDLLDIALSEIARCILIFDSSHGRTLEEWQKYRVRKVILTEIQKKTRRSELLPFYRNSYYRIEHSLPEDHFPDVFQQDRAREFLSGLKEKEREQVLEWSQGMGPSEIAARAGKPSATVYSSLSRSLPYFKLAQSEECRNGHIRSPRSLQSRPPTRKGSKNALACKHCHNLAFSLYYSNKKEAS